MSEKEREGERERGREGRFTHRGDPVPQKHAVEDVALLEGVLPPDVAVTDPKEEAHVHVQGDARQVPGIAKVVKKNCQKGRLEERERQRERRTRWGPAGSTQRCG